MSHWSTHSFFSQLCHSTIARLAVVMLFALVWGSAAFCDEIHDAASEGDLAKVKALLKDNPDLVFSKDINGDTALHLAAYHGYKDVAKLLLANKANINAKDNTGWTPLHLAAYNDQKDMAEFLLVNKAGINAKDNAGSTPLHFAAANGYQDVAEVLRQYGGRESSADAQTNDKQSAKKPNAAKSGDHRIASKKKPVTNLANGTMKLTITSAVASLGPGAPDMDVTDMIISRFQSGNSLHVRWSAHGTLTVNYKYGDGETLSKESKRDGSLDITPPHSAAGGTGGLFTPPPLGTLIAETMAGMLTPFRLGTLTALR